ncbi:uncharacterized protein EAF01_005033 [Botrytis porri]|uniref:uncharacterized protein n=1 Tax=Botrytis porri TaxID=87229 RepID=UPI001901EC61|nr:uncharacterized protein EAF01_005033 [Botrytis porri]KAF7907447.1 hypothetical protein EAF01_005033 [Botrytis porri]
MYLKSMQLLPGTNIHQRCQSGFYCVKNAFVKDESLHVQYSDDLARFTQTLFDINFHSGKNKYYKPFATRTTTLIILLVAKLLLIILLEYSCHVIPQHSGFRSITEELVNITRAEEASLSNETSPSTSVGFAASPSATTSTPTISSGKSTTHTVSLTGAGSPDLNYKATTTISVLTLSRASHFTPGTATSTSFNASYLTPITDKSTPIDSIARDKTYLSPGTGITRITDSRLYQPITSAPGMIISGKPEGLGL